MSSTIDGELCTERLSIARSQTELRKIRKEMADLEKRLAELRARRTELEKVMKKQPTEQAAATVGVSPQSHRALDGGRKSE